MFSHLLSEMHFFIFALNLSLFSEKNQIKKHNCLHCMLHGNVVDKNVLLFSHLFFVIIVIIYNVFVKKVFKRLVVDSGYVILLFSYGVYYFIFMYVLRKSIFVWQ